MFFVHPNFHFAKEYKTLPSEKGLKSIDLYFQYELTGK